MDRRKWLRLAGCAWRVSCVLLALLLAGCSGLRVRHREDDGYEKFSRERPILYVARPTLFLASEAEVEETRPAPGLELHNFIVEEARKRVGNVVADYEVCVNLVPRLRVGPSEYTRIPYPQAAQTSPDDPEIIPANPLPPDLFPRSKWKRHYLHVHSGIEEHPGQTADQFAVAVFAALYFVDVGGRPDVIGYTQPEGSLWWAQGDDAVRDPEKAVAALASPAAHGGAYARMLMDAVDGVLEFD
jgi:hypothetical protein